jgi:hypothetical protein
MSHINLLTRNYSYSGIRAVITASQSGDINTYYVEGGGERYYVNSVGSTASAEMESASFQSFMSFTMSGFATYSVNLIPMEPEESVMIDTHVVALNQTGTKGYVARFFGGFRHSGSALSAIGGSIDSNVKTDFSTVAVSFTASGTQSVLMRLVGQTSETIDFDIHVAYTKGFHSLIAATSSGGTTPPKPIYPQPNNPTS